MKKVIKFVPGQFEIVADSENKSVNIHLINSSFKKEFRTPMLFTFDGKWFYKVSGGKAVYYDKVVRRLRIDTNTLKEIFSFLNEVRKWNGRK